MASTRKTSQVSTPTTMPAQPSDSGMTINGRTAEIMIGRRAYLL
jgi:hypothetical protein